MLTVVIVASLFIGSFAAVAANRVAGIVKRSFRDSNTNKQNEASWKLKRVLFTCGHCDTPVRWFRFLPLLDRAPGPNSATGCSACTGWTQTVMVLASAILAGASFTLFDGSYAIAVYLVCLTLLILAIIDMRTMLLPDILTLPLLWAALLYKAVYTPDLVVDAIFGAAAGYLILWSVYWCFRLLTGREGIGYGDFKLLAALCAWLGWQSLPLLLLVSAGVGTCVGIIIQSVRSKYRGEPMPFGPFLAGGGIIMLLAGEPLLNAAHQFVIGN